MISSPPFSDVAPPRPFSLSLFHEFSSPLLLTRDADDAALLLLCYAMMILPRHTDIMPPQGATALIMATLLIYGTRASSSSNMAAR